MIKVFNYLGKIALPGEMITLRYNHNQEGMSSVFFKTKGLSFYYVGM